VSVKCKFLKAVAEYGTYFDLEPPSFGFDTCFIFLSVDGAFVPEKDAGDVRWR
jgi:hypothetical protein